MCSTNLQKKNYILNGQGANFFDELMIALLCLKKLNGKNSFAYNFDRFIKTEIVSLSKKANAHAQKGILKD